MTDAPFRYPVEIQFRHCDPAGIVYYPRFIDMVEGAIEEWMGVELGESYRDWIVGQRLGLPRVKVSAEFKRTCTMGERLELLLRLARVGRSSFEVHVEGEVAGDPRFAINIVLVNMSLDTMKAVPFTEAMRQKLERFRTEGARSRSRKTGRG
jgi:4-hydroxybenzoyl-CoA thioesterase